MHDPLRRRWRRELALARARNLHQSPRYARPKRPPELVLSEFDGEGLSVRAVQRDGRAAVIPPRDERVRRRRWRVVVEVNVLERAQRAGGQRDRDVG